MVAPVCQVAGLHRLNIKFNIKSTKCLKRCIRYTWILLLMALVVDHDDGRARDVVGQLQQAFLAAWRDVLNIG